MAKVKAPPKKTKNQTPKHPSKLIPLNLITHPDLYLLICLFVYGGAMGHMWRSEDNLHEFLLFGTVCGSQGLNSSCQMGGTCFYALSHMTRQFLAQNYQHTSPVSGCRSLPYIQCLLHSTVTAIMAFRESLRVLPVIYQPPTAVSAPTSLTPEQH